MIQSQTASSYVNGIRTANDLDTLYEKIRTLFLFCNKNDFGYNSSLCAENGAIEVLYQIVCKHMNTDQYTRTKQEVFRALGVMCFSNSQVAQRVAQNEHFNIVEISLETSPEACYLISNLAAYSWESHPMVLHLVPRALNIIKVSQSESQKSWCVRFCGQLSYNKANKQYLLKTEIVDMMIQTTLTLNSTVGCCTSFASLACLLSDNINQSLLVTIATPDILDLVLRCFRSAIRGVDFPVGSRVYYTDWKMAAALDNLCEIKTIRKILIEYKLLEMVNLILKNSGSVVLKTHCLSILWKLCSP
eukprot:c18410_g1_i2.p1 GENE.c18410_g1_i2~~c18410_g1_i2.p1  ORF type:complete len:303 (+),score=74.25 c18410_g1_i2:23-931(+)